MNISLKTKMALAGAILFIAFSAAIAWFSISYFENKFKQSLANQQYALACATADNIDNKLIMLQKALVAASQNLPPAITADAGTAQRFLDERVTLHSLFDTTLFLLRTDGTIIAESPALPERSLFDLSHREYFRKTVAAGKPVISSPYLSSLPDHRPVVMLTAPVFDYRGKLTCILCGGMRLLGSNLLGDVTRMKIGTTGYAFLAAADRTMIVHPDKARIMKMAAAPGENKLFDKAIAGFDGSGEAVNSRSVPMLASYRHLRATNWVLGLNFPLEEAYAPIYRCRQYLLVGIAGGTLAILVIAWLVMKRLTDPLINVTRQVEAMGENTKGLRLLSHRSSDEIGTLANAFNRMVTEQERQQEALRESENNFRALAETASDGMLVIAGEARFLFANQRIADMTGYAIPELLELGIENLVIPETLPSVRERIATIIAGKEFPRQYETSLVHKDGSIIPVEVTSALTAWRGMPADLVILRDIGERKRAEKALRDSYSLLQNTFASLNEAVFIVETGTRKILDYNDAVKDMFGYARGELIGATTSCLHVDEEMSRRFGEAMLKAYEDRGYFETTYRMKRRNGAVFDSEHFVTPIYDDDDRIISHVCVVRDVSERKLAEEKLRESEEKFRNLVETTSDLVWEVDERGVYTYTSPRLHDILGYEPQEVVGRTPCEFMSPEDGRRFASMFRSMAASREAITCLENTTIHKDGRQVVLEKNAMPFFDRDGNLRGYRGIDRDITERKNIEEQIIQLAGDVQRRAAELATANRELETFSYSLSHDLKAPLACIYTSFQALEEGHAHQLDANGRFFLNSIHKASVRMEELLNAMLQLARVTRSELQCGDVDLSGLAREILLQLRMEQPDRKVDWVVAPDIEVIGDPRLLRSAMENLFGNAWKYTRHTDRALIEFGVAGEGGEQVYFVRDNGAGFPMEAAQRLFHPFQRLHQGEEFEGTGIGLATVQRIIQRHGGRIWGEGETGRGATFCFTLGEPCTANTFT